MKRKFSLVLLIVFICLIFNSLKIDYVFSADNKKFNMSYLYFGKPSQYTRLVDSTNGSLDLVAISFFDIDKNGNLVLTNRYSPTFIEDMHKRGIKVVSFLSNHWNIEAGRNGLKNKEKLAEDVARAIDLYNLDGVNVDIEGLDNRDRDDYTEFVRLLSEKITEGKQLSVAVAANPFYIDNLWQGSYDYIKLSEYSDFLMVMTYDESWQGSSPGPVASSRFVERSIQYALERVPKEKIVLGIPFYGRYWENGAVYGGYGIGLNDIEVIKSKYEFREYYDEIKESPFIVFNIRPEDEKTFIFGRELMPGTYTIWYENERSIKHKLSLVRKYDLAGTGSWSLGQETQDVWDYYSLCLNGKYFIDIDGHWAEEEIIAAEQKGLIRGVTNNMFYPDGPLSRAQLAVLIVRMLDLQLIEEEADIFTDINGHWAAREIETAAIHGFIFGMGGNKFEPNAIVTREQATVLIDRVLGLSEPVVDARKTFSDLKKGSWSYEPIVRMASYHIVNGYPDGLFYPGSKMTRAQMTVLINKIVGNVSEQASINYES